MSEISEDVQTENDVEKRRTVDVFSRARRALHSVHVEPLVICYITSRTLMLLATQNLSLQKACRVNLRLGDDTCTALEHPDGQRSSEPSVREQEVATQQLVTNMLIWQLVVQNSVPCVLAIFMGSWSDRNRKRVPCMLLPMGSELVRVFGLLACVYYFYELPMEVVGVVEAVPTSLAGGRMVLFNALFSYVADVTAEEFKTLRIGVVNLLSVVGMAIGTALSGITFQKLGFWGVYTASLSLYIFGFLYTWIRIKEVSPASVQAETTTRTKNNGLFRGFFDAKHIRDAFKVTFKGGPNNRKINIIMLMCIAFLIMGPFNGEQSIAYLNTRVRFHWDEVKYSEYSTYNMVTSSVGTALSIGLFSHVLKIDDNLIGVMACVGKIIAGLFYAFATVEWVYCLGPLLDIMGGTIFITARSIMTKIVGLDEIGQVTAIYSIVESLVPIVFGPLYNVVYKSTVDILPGAYSLIGSILAVPATLIYLWMYKESKLLKKHNHDKDKVENDQISVIQINEKN